MFRALLAEKIGDSTRTTLQEIDEARLPDGDVAVEVLYSTLNYKDALAITGDGPVVRSFPMVPGIDLAGRVMESRHPDWQPGDAVVLNGWGVGETHWGALAEKARLDGNWLIRLPAAFDARSAMAIGTAGYTAMLSVIALERQGVAPDRGEVLVTGATGGVGSVAVMLLARLGYSVAAVTGRSAEHGDYLRRLGAATVLDRQDFSEAGKPLGKERWAGAVDSVGGRTLANVCATLKRGGTVAACGLAGGMDLPASVAPFILRGVRLIGIDSVYRPRNEREEAWTRLGELVDVSLLESATSEIGLESAIDAARGLLDGRSKGRIVVDVRR
ncbi:MDR family oxidoreductase [Aureimonas leprariae]|uniref:Oxidoreductase n=1 Tax=Plantimonas leprariae TaxID=2615207 RepID=A0A7V7TVG4_9HYPH|nr:MDR family oxidoreductase [Aureimonas leprariae]KAB0677753.1 oxidoreductase [Aureimonas leprariae]